MHHGKILLFFRDVGDAIVDGRMNGTKGVLLQPSLVASPGLPAYQDAKLSRKAYEQDLTARSPSSGEVSDDAKSESKKSDWASRLAVAMIASPLPKLANS
jgi:hypothetical protein